MLLCVAILSIYRSLASFFFPLYLLLPSPSLTLSHLNKFPFVQFVRHSGGHLVSCRCPSFPAFAYSALTLPSVHPSIHSLAFSYMLPWVHLRNTVTFAPRLSSFSCCCFLSRS
ncbi:hypothetical protein F4781DRAFT_165887 [Annulohypoxylon bovei var. microspora]|nr:hypothetical protein F4781DRAFT_165887 [Annulohypoxylon bovei var. microspora]